MVYVDRIVCLNLLTGAPIWSSKTLPWGTAIAANMFSAPAIEGGWLYMGTGNAVAPAPPYSGAAGFIRVDAATGALGWARGGSLGTDLEGSAGGTRVTPPVIIGDEVYFANENGMLFALDKNTGVTKYFTTVYVVPLSTTKAKMMASLSSNGVDLYVATADAVSAPLASGAIYCFTPTGTAFTQKWVYEQPAAIQAAYPGGFWSAPSYRCDNLFIQSWAVRDVVPGVGLCGYRQNLDPATGVQKWFEDIVAGAAYFAPPATMGTAAGPVAIFSNYNTSGYNGAPTTRGIRAVNFANATLWAINGTESNWDNQVWNSATVTQDNWVFYGIADRTTGFGLWRIVDGTDGTVVIEYATTGYVNNTAIAHGSDGNDYIVISTYCSVILPPR